MEDSCKDLLHLTMSLEVLLHSQLPYYLMDCGQAGGGGGGGGGGHPML